MSERYSRLFSLPENLYTEGSPVVIKAGALLKDNETDRLVAQLKIQSISNKTIKLVKVELTCLDSLNRLTGNPVVYEYLDLIIERGEDFGTQTPIKISDYATRAYTVRVTEVGFVDNTVWSNADRDWTTLPKQAPITNVISNRYTLLAYKYAFGEKANYVTLEHKNMWFCTCGEINHSN